jgi:hydroxyethylthiazole kinase-like uncharacterized protein yjeF
MKKLTAKDITTVIKPRLPNTNKGNFGHACLIVGSRLMIGSAIISAKACMRSGVGKLTVHLPKNEAIALPITIPEAIISIRENKEINFELYTAIGIGCGLGVTAESTEILLHLLTNYKKPIVLDADALHIISKNKEMLNMLPKNTILTPHPKEFDLLFGKQKSSEERNNTAIAKSKIYKIIIVVKGNETMITSNGKAVKNSTGNAGLAKAGSGDALTGMITAFLAQGYVPFDAAKIAVYLHGLASDICLQKQSMESMLITDVIRSIGKAFKKLNR